MITFKSSKQAPFKIEELLSKEVELIYREDYKNNTTSLKQIIAPKQSAPSLIYISSWRDGQIREIAKTYRKQSKVVLGMDNKWLGKFKQHLFTILAPLVLKPIAPYIFIPDGKLQRKYAKKLGYKDAEIFTPLYTANTQQMEVIRTGSGRKTVKSIMFLGRMTIEKGVEDLIQAFSILQSKSPEWILDLVGTGPLLDKYQSNQLPCVRFRGFVSPNDIGKVLKEATIFCLPTHKDQWGLVVHEAACMSLPMVLSDACGAADAFLEVNKNGYSFRAGDVEDLKNRLEKMMHLPSQNLKDFGTHSLKLSKQVNERKWVEAIKQILAS